MKSSLPNTKFYNFSRKFWQVTALSWTFWGPQGVQKFHWGLPLAPFPLEPPLTLCISNYDRMLSSILLPRDAIYKRGICRHAVYVCLFVCHRVVCRAPIMGSLKSPYRTFYTSAIESTTLNWLFFEKIAFCVWILATNKQTNEQTDNSDA